MIEKYIPKQREPRSKLLETIHAWQLRRVSNLAGYSFAKEGTFALPGCEDSVRVQFGSSSKHIEIDRSRGRRGSHLVVDVHWDETYGDQMQPYIEATCQRFEDGELDGIPETFTSGVDSLNPLSLSDIVGDLRFAKRLVASVEARAGAVALQVPVNSLDA